MASQRPFGPTCLARGLAAFDVTNEDVLETAHWMANRVGSEDSFSGETAAVATRRRQSRRYVLQEQSGPSSKSDVAGEDALETAPALDDRPHGARGHLQRRDRRGSDTSTAISTTPKGLLRGVVYIDRQIVGRDRSEAQSR